jgi:hypothetical protein
VELGVKLRADTAGFITGVRFYKGAGNTGAHTGSLWSSTGTLLATAPFTGETASGWQQVNFAAPVAVAANTTYVASYFAPAGHYAGDGDFFNGTGAGAAPLRALASGVDGPNGVYRYGSGGAFPTDSFNATNYWVDVVFTTTGPPAATATATPTATATAAPATPTATTAALAPQATTTPTATVAAPPATATPTAPAGTPAATLTATAAPPTFTPTAAPPTATRTPTAAPPTATPTATG